MGRRRRIMGVVMKEQDKRAIESMCRCGLDLEGVISIFPTFPKEDVMAIYNSAKGLNEGTEGELNISINCSNQLWILQEIVLKDVKYNGYKASSLFGHSGFPNSAKSVEKCKKEKCLYVLRTYFSL